MQYYDGGGWMTFAKNIAQLELTTTSALNNKVLKLDSVLFN